MVDFTISDDIFDHLKTVVPQLDDLYLSSKYAGFAAVSAVAVFELNVKQIIFSFCKKKHHVFGDFAERQFDRINGRIKLDNLSKDYTKAFGEKYELKWKRKIDDAENKFLEKERRSLKNSYTNIINWRNEFAHSGRVPPFATFDEVLQAYGDGKLVIECFGTSLTR